MKKNYSSNFNKAQIYRALYKQKYARFIIEFKLKTSSFTY